MTIDKEDCSVHDILMCVIGDALMEADASFMFGHNFGPIIDKWGPLLQRKQPKVEWIRKDIQKLKTEISEINKSTPFLGASHEYIQDRLDDLEREICD